MSEKRTRGPYRTERVKRLIANFHEDFMSGMTISEIEKKYHVSDSYAYNFLEEIAAKNNVSVETYYQKEHGPHICLTREGKLLPNKNVSFTEIRSNLQTASDALDKASSHLEELSGMIEQELERQ